MTLSLRFAAVSDVGLVRKDNQDSAYVGPYLLVVADGVGGGARGDVASTAAVQQLRTIDEPDSHGSLADTLMGSISLAHNRIRDLVSDSPDLEGTSTTVVAGLFNGTQMAIAHVGDSRAYLLRDGVMQALTRDHSFVQSLVDEGSISEDDAKIHPNRNLILRAVDGVHEPQVDTRTVDLKVGDRLLFCTDGCCGVLTDQHIAELLGSDSVADAAQSLVTASLNYGSTDNVTVAVAEVVPLDPAELETVEPDIVGAAALPLRPPTRSTLRRRRTAEPVDPELARYAPLPPKRRRILRLILALLVVGAVIAGVLYGFAKWKNDQYYLGVQDGTIAIFRGVPWDPFGHSLHHVVEVTRTPISTISNPTDLQTLQHPDLDSLASENDVRERLAAITNRNLCTPVSRKPSETPTPRATASNKPSAHPTTPAKPAPTPCPTP